MTALLNLHKQYKDSISTEELLNRLYERQCVIAAGYEKLYQENNYPFVSLPVYLNDLLQRVSRTLGGYCSGIRFIKDVADLRLHIKQATAFAQILIELVSNSYRHAFAGISTDRIIEYHITNVENKLHFEYSDNGCGLPEGFVPAKSRTLGMQFINSLSKQLGGTPVFKEKPEEGIGFSLVIDIRKD